MTNEADVQNDTRVFDAMRVDRFTGITEWTGRKGTLDAIHSDGLVIDPISEGYCPHQWIDNGYVNLALSQKYPYAHRRAS
jgi:hypothetical protein